MSGLSLLDHISIIKDPRQTWKITHSLSDIIFLTIAAVIAGAEGWEDIEDFGEDNLSWLREYGDFTHGIPVHDTIARVINLIPAKKLQKCFSAWMKDCHELTSGDVIAIDGKTLRGTYNKDKRCGAIHMVSAFSAANQVVLGQVKTSEKSNEITAIPELLKLLDIRGCIVTIDAMGCQKYIAKAIVEKDADYLLAVKGNQKKLEQAVGKVFNSSMLNAFSGDQYSIQEQGHGRTETRLALVEHNTSLLGDIAFDWKNIQTIGVVVSVRQEGNKPAETITIRHYISSAKLTAKELLEKSRAHWSIEVQLH
ncbi:ISAs1 family transposase, partial [Vibrio sp. S11_S32]|uniref:ISAs1 family transposase n=1 Tax=Vibrio sp. S11_S32 TaxID=2720225 RepID=UPI00168165E1